MLLILDHVNVSFLQTNFTTPHLQYQKISQNISITNRCVRYAQKPAAPIYLCFYNVF